MGDNSRERGTQPSTVIVRDHATGDNDTNQENICEMDLERASIRQANTIIIEPTKLGEDTSRWITVGNFLHKATVVSGLGSMTCLRFWPDHTFVYIPLGFVSVTFAGVYAVSWQFDPFCKYQVEHSVHKFDKLPLHNLTSNAPVVLIRRDDFRRKVLHNIVAVAAGGLCAWKLYQLINEKS